MGWMLVSIKYYLVSGLRLFFSMVSIQLFNFFSFEKINLFDHYVSNSKFAIILLKSLFKGIY